MDNQDLTNLIESLINLSKETEWVEFKENNKTPDEIGEYISALSNGACLHDQKYGYLVFGIEDGTHKVKGTSFKPKFEKIGNEELENWLLVHLSPRIDFKIHEFEYKDMSIVLFVIDATTQKPVSFKNVEHIRVGSYKKKLNDFPEKARKIWNKTSKITFENSIALKDVSNDDVIKLLDYPSYFDLLKLNLPSNKQGILSKLEEEKILVKKKDGVYDITNLGAILFARDLNSFAFLSRKAIRVVQYKGKNKVKTLKEQVITKGYANGFDSLITYVNDQLPSKEEIGKSFRTEIKMYPELAIRELVANALIHQDFDETGTSPMIEIYEDRIEINNPGRPLINPLRFLDYSPQSRNEQLASFMRRLNICEERGSGIDKVVSQTELFELPAPKFIQEQNYLKAILYSQKSLRQMDKEDKVRAAYLHCCLKFVSNEIMTNQSLRERFRVEEKNYSTISRIIADTIDAKLIKDEDPTNKSRKYAKYIPVWA
jgi:predicted HTH transcriptional regulator